MTTVEQEVDHFVKNYSVDFSNLNLDAVVSYFHVPCIFLVPGEVLAFSSASEVEGFWRPRLADLKKEGFGRTEIQGRDITVLNDDNVIYSAKIIRYASDGSYFGNRTTTFVLRKTNNGWKMATLIHHSSTPGYSQELTNESES